MLTDVDDVVFATNDQPRFADLLVSFPKTRVVVVVVVVVVNDFEGVVDVAE